MFLRFWKEILTKTAVDMYSNFMSVSLFQIWTFDAIVFIVIKKIVWKWSEVISSEFLNQKRLFL